MRRTAYRVPMIIAAGSVLVIAAVLTIIWTMQRRLIYFPTSDVPAPGAIGLTDVEEVTFATIDGLRLSGWFFAASTPSPRVTVLVFNGNAGNRAHRDPLATALQRDGFQVLLFDYRGYGGNPGTPSESGLALDARAARAYLAHRPDVDPSRLAYFGESLGTAVTVDLAVEHPPAALVLRSPFTSLGDLGQYHYPFLPVRLLLQDRFAAIDRIRRIRVPLLVIVGGHDRIVPIDNSRRLYEAAETRKTLLVLPDADHNDYELLAGDKMIQAIARFLQPLT
ncbi:MAG TPA: alpha/beta hydrolase [Vicinamibacterales bacterium]|nr:alpha/beta hydrolase [Vicinamibacterales bacterium]